MSGYAGNSTGGPLDWLNETSAVLEFLGEVMTCRAPASVALGCEWRLSDDALFGQYLILEHCRFTIKNAVDTIQSTYKAQPPTMPA